MFASPHHRRAPQMENIEPADLLHYLAGGLNFPDLVSKVRQHANKYMLTGLASKLTNRR